MARRVQQLLRPIIGGEKPLKRGEDVAARCNALLHRGMSYDAETKEYMAALYGVTAEDIDEAIEEIESAQRLPFVLSHPVWERIMHIDNL